MAKKDTKAANPKPKGSKSPKSGSGSKTVRKVAKKASRLASNPIVAEVVAATLVAAAAAIRDPKKARAMATAAGEELKSAAEGAKKTGDAWWQLAMDVAARSIDALGGADAKSNKKSKKKKK
jgi:hypothetical protein